MAGAGRGDARRRGAAGDGEVREVHIDVGKGPIGAPWNMVGQEGGYVNGDGPFYSYIREGQPFISNQENK